MLSIFGVFTSAISAPFPTRVFCDDCDEKKATLRRTCFSDLPKTLLVHLKRFDLDYGASSICVLHSCRH